MMRKLGIKKIESKRQALNNVTASVFEKGNKTKNITIPQRGMTMSETINNEFVLGICMIVRLFFIAMT